jgi:hypothetical protein
VMPAKIESAIADVCDSVCDDVADIKHSAAIENRKLEHAAYKTIAHSSTQKESQHNNIKQPKPKITQWGPMGAKQAIE